MLVILIDLNYISKIKSKIKNLSQINFEFNIEINRTPLSPINCIDAKINFKFKIIYLKRRENNACYYTTRMDTKFLCTVGSWYPSI